MPCVEQSSIDQKRVICSFDCNVLLWPLSNKPQQILSLSGSGMGSVDDINWVYSDL